MFVQQNNLFKKKKKVVTEDFKYYTWDILHNLKRIEEKP